MIHIFTTTTCPRCGTLKAYLERCHIAYISSDLDPAAITDMRCSGFHNCLSAPIIMRRPGEYYGPEEFFEGDRLDEMKLRGLIA